VIVALIAQVVVNPTTMGPQQPPATWKCKIIKKQKKTIDFIGWILDVFVKFHIF
jgi:hypothetical protein